MKKLFPLICLFILISGTCYAAPFLTCDAYPTTVVQPTYFVLKFDNGTPFQVNIYTLTDGSITLMYDMASAGLPNGNHIVAAAAGNELEVSAYSADFPFRFPLPTTGPTSPSSLKLIKTVPQGADAKRSK